ncbi:hypothetical protein V9T40_004797 [Parthenolecanium corni]|uniref:Uncharacterized protein n=1 Tax=Parthenolecanium corni TaxID=536013 RepID=A0AAN9Y278_9HEMI
MAAASRLWCVTKPTGCASGTRKRDPSRGRAAVDEKRSDGRESESFADNATREPSSETPSPRPLTPIRKRGQLRPISEIESHRTSAPGEFGRGCRLRRDEDDAAAAAGITLVRAMGCARGAANSSSRRGRQSARSEGKCTSLFIGGR